VSICRVDNCGGDLCSCKISKDASTLGKNDRGTWRDDQAEEVADPANLPSLQRRIRPGRRRHPLSDSLKSPDKAAELVLEAVIRLEEGIRIEKDGRDLGSREEAVQFLLACARCCLLSRGLLHPRSLPLPGLG
jgi:hypothetical protein